MNARQKLLKEFIIKQKTVKISDVATAFSYISPNTLKKDLQYLKTEQILETIVTGKGMIYTLKH